MAPHSDGPAPDGWRSWRPRSSRRPSWRRGRDTPWARGWPTLPSPRRTRSAATPPTGIVAPVAPVTPEPPVAPEPPEVEPPEPPEPPKLPAFGAYVDYDGPRGTARIAELSRWLGGADLTVGHTYLPGDRWSNIEGLPGFLDVWADWRRAEEDRLFVLNVPMLERNEEGVPDRQVRVQLRRGAAGLYDHHFRALAERLVELKIPDTVIVLGWEMNGITYTHRCGPDPEAWKKYWNRIVTTMRAVPGQKFRFDFTPTPGGTPFPGRSAIPGTTRSTSSAWIRTTSPGESHSTSR